MHPKDVLAYYEGSQSAIAKALNLSRQAIHGWYRPASPKTLVPPLQAMRLHELTGGELSFDPSNYALWNKKKPAKGARARA
jgi:hypothetical protein